MFKAARPPEKTRLLYRARIYGILESEPHDAYPCRMNTIQDIIWHLYGAFLFSRQVLGYSRFFIVALLSPKSKLAARLLAAESQLTIYNHRISQKKEPRPSFNPAFRFLWVLLSRYWNGWRSAAHLMQPATVLKWHRQGFRLYWRWKSRKRGRPKVDVEMRKLIKQLSSENRLWSAERIHDHLVLLGFDPPHPDTIRKYMVKHDPSRGGSQTWLTFIRNHLTESWAIDFCTVPTISFKILYVFVILDHSRRQVLHFNVTRYPCMDWIILQLKEAMPFGKQPRFLFRDNDGIYGNGVGAFLKMCGIEEVRTAYHSPWQNPFVERFFGTQRRELLNHIVPINEEHCYRLIKEFIEEYYHPMRPHMGLDSDTPIPHPRTLLSSSKTKLKAIQSSVGCIINIIESMHKKSISLNHDRILRRCSVRCNQWTHSIDISPWDPVSIPRYFAQKSYGSDYSRL